MMEIFSFPFNAMQTLLFGETSAKNERLLYLSYSDLVFLGELLWK